MKRFSLIFIILLGIVFATAITGCNTSEESSGNNESSKSNEEANEISDTNDNEIDSEPSEPVDLEIILSGDANLPDPDEDIFKQALDEELGTNINMNAYVGEEDYYNQLNVRLSAGDFPDLFQVNRNYLQQYVDQGLILDLSEYESELHQTREWLGEEELIKGVVDGGQYALMKKPQIPYHTYWLREDWLNKLELDVPTTLDELVEVWKAFTFDDPDGNGQQDTFGISGAGLAAFDPVFGAYGIGTPGTGNFYIRDGELINSLYEPEMPDALTFIHDVIEEGVVDPELIANTSGQHEEKAYQGEVGMIHWGFPRFTFPAAVEEFKSVNPDAEWLQLEPPVGPNGEQYDGVWDIGSSPTLWAIPKSLENEPEKLQKIFDLFNYVSSEEGLLLVQHGIEGEHYTIEDGAPVANEYGLSGVIRHNWLYQFAGRNEMEYLVARGYPEDAVKLAGEVPRIETVNSLILYPDNYNPADADRYIEEEIVKFVYGERLIDEYEDFLDTLENTFDYNLLMDAAEEQLNELGLLD